MSYSVIVLPGNVICEKCGSHLAQRDPTARTAHSIVLYCGHHDCEQKDVGLVFPLEVRELQRAE